jgi:hypothetical protein
MTEQAPWRVVNLVSLTCKHYPIPSDTAQAQCVQCNLEAANPDLYDLSRFVHLADCPSERNRVGCDCRDLRMTL